jgi:hypothetical protein
MVMSALPRGISATLAVRLPGPAKLFICRGASVLVADPVPGRPSPEAPFV